MSNECPPTRPAIPEWHQWPRGKYGHNIFSDLKCPVCNTKLRAVNMISDWHAGGELWDFICPHCKTQYAKGVERGSIKQQYADPRDEEIAQLKAQVRYLYGLIQELQKKEQHPPARPPRVVHEEENHDADHDDFTEKYRYLMS